MITKLLFSFSLLMLSLSIQAQNINLSGTITDAESGETITGAIVSAPEFPGIGIATNTYGYFSLSVPKGNQKIKIKFIGYEERLEDINLVDNLKRNFGLCQQEIQERLYSNHIQKCLIGLEIMDID